MTVPHPPLPRITVYPDERAMAKAVAASIVGALHANPRLVLGLPTGRTPVRLYQELAAAHTKHGADFSRATTFNLDEFVGVPASHPGSYRSFMDRHLFSKVNLGPEMINFLRGDAPDLERECERYECAIAAAGGIDLQLLGIGTNGHIGFNEPARQLEARTHRVQLTSSTRRSNAALFGGDPDNVPTEALSVGMATILQARRIVLLATGKSKAGCIERMMRGPITPKLPASFLQLHPDVEIAVDQAAASGL